jgi:hypothetical protein
MLGSSMPLTAIISIAGICISAGLTITLFVLARRSKEIRYWVLSTRLVGIRERELDSHLQILFDGRQVLDPGLVFVTIKNSGREPIPREDFDEPLTLRLSGGRIISAEVTKTIPPDLRAGVALIFPRDEGSPTASDVTITPLLLNQGDFLTIKLVVSNFYDANLEVHGRVIGVASLREFEDKPYRGKIVLQALLTAGGLCALLSLLRGSWFYRLGVVMVIAPPLVLPYVDLLFPRRIQTGASTGNSKADAATTRLL